MMRETSETILPFRHARGDGAIVFEPGALPQTPEPGWFDPARWGDAAQRVGNGGRGAAWFVQAPWGAMLLRRYLRGGWVARFSRDGHVWRGERVVRSFTEFHVLRALSARGLPVPAPLAAAYWREGRHYRAAILMERIMGVRTFGERVLADPVAAPWGECGALIARFHRAGVDHADLNAYNLLFDDADAGWMIDFDKARLRGDAEGGWRAANLSRLKRSLHKLGGEALSVPIDAGFTRLRAAYDAAMAAGVAS